MPQHRQYTNLKLRQQRGRRGRCPNSCSASITVTCINRSLSAATSAHQHQRIRCSSIGIGDSSDGAATTKQRHHQEHSSYIRGAEILWPQNLGLQLLQRLRQLRSFRYSSFVNSSTGVAQATTHPDFSNPSFSCSSCCDTDTSVPITTPHCPTHLNTQTAEPQRQQVTAAHLIINSPF